MFEAYKVGVRISLISNVARQLTDMSFAFGKVGKEVDALNAKLKSLHKIAIASGMAIGAGFLGFKGLKHALTPGAEYTHQLNVLTMHGLKQKELAEATAEAWKMTKDNMATTPTQNLRTIMDLHNVLGHLHEAISYAPTVAKIGTVMASSTETNISGNASKIAEGVAFAVAKGLDIRNAAGNITEFDKQAAMMTKVITAYGNKITPEDYRQFFTYGRGATQGLSNEFLYEELPTFMLEMKSMKGGSGSRGGFGNAIAMWHKFYSQNVMPKYTFEAMQDYGFYPKNVDYKDARRLHIKGYDLANSDPFKFMQQIALPLIRKKLGKDDLSNQEITNAINDMMRGASATAIFAAVQMAIKAQNTYRDQAIIKAAMDYNEGFKQAYSSDPYIAMAAFKDQWETFQTAFTMGVIPFVIPAIMKLSAGLNELAQWARENPNLASGIAYGIGIVSAALVGFGLVLGTRTMFAIIGAKTALDSLNATLLRTAAVAGGASGVGAAAGAGGYMSGAGYAAAGAASKAAPLGLLTRFGLIGLTGYLIYQLIRDIHNQPSGITAPGYMDVTDAMSNPHSKAAHGVINLQIKEQTFATVMMDEINKILNRGQYGTSSYVPVQNPPPPGTSAPF